MAAIDPDPQLPLDLAEGERVVGEFRPDPQAYWGGHLVLAVILGVLCGLMLLLLGNPYPVVGPVGAVTAVAARAAFVQPQAMARVWRLTDRRLLGPEGQALPLAQLLTAKPLLGSVQLTLTTGQSHLVRYQSDPAAVAYLLQVAAGRKPRHG
jgi:hypothetical protein